MRISTNGLRRGTTLIELTVVLALIALLLTLAIPAYNSALRTARQFQCHGHLRQWGVATQLYAMANDDFLPPDGAPNGRSTRAGWYVSLPKELRLEPYHEAPWRTNALAPLPRSIWFCPANKRRSNGHNLFHYCLNQHINGRGAGNQIKQTSLGQPERLIWLFDNRKQAAVAQQNNVHTNLHGTGAQFLLLDGHVEHQTSNLYWNYEANQGRKTGPLLWHPNPPKTD